MKCLQTVLHVFSVLPVFPRRAIIHGHLDRQSQEKTTTEKNGANFEEVKHNASKSPCCF